MSTPQKCPPTRHYLKRLQITADLRGDRIEADRGVCCLDQADLAHSLSKMRGIGGVPVVRPVSLGRVYWSRATVVGVPNHQARLGVLPDGDCTKSLIVPRHATCG